MFEYHKGSYTDIPGMCFFSRWDAGESLDKANATFLRRFVWRDLAYWFLWDTWHGQMVEIGSTLW